MRPTQGAGRGWRSDLGWLAAAWRLPLGARRPQAEPRRADGPAGRSQRLAGGRGRTGTPSPWPCRGWRGHGGQLDRPGLWPGRVLTFDFELFRLSSSKCPDYCLWIDPDFPGLFSYRAGAFSVITTTGNAA